MAAQDPKVPGYTLHQAARDIAGLRGAVAHNSASPVYAITTGFPTNWSGTVNYTKLAPISAGIVFLKWRLFVASGQAVASPSATLFTLPSGFYFASDTTFMWGTSNTVAAGLMELSSTGLFTFNGTAFTSGGNYIYGQAVYSTLF
jgi:hypothetical protein